MSPLGGRTRIWPIINSSLSGTARSPARVSRTQFPGEKSKGVNVRGSALGFFAAEFFDQFGAYSETTEPQFVDQR